MGWGKTIVQKLFAAKIDELVAERLPAAVGTRLSEIGWRKLTGAPTRELPMMDQARAIEVAYWLWKTNPLAMWIIEVVTAFAMANGMPFTCKNDAVKDVLTEFWEDPVNRLDLHWENHVRELGIYGELCLPVFISEQMGRVRLGFIDPAMIGEVFADPENVKIKIGLTVSSGPGTEPRRLKIVLDEENEGVLSEAGKTLRESFTDGECFYFSINALTNELRGSSDLFTIADHLDNYEQFLYDSGEKYARFNDFYYDITVEGADAKKLEEEREKYEPPRNGGAFIHNEKVKSEAVAPDLKSEDSNTAARLHRNHILGSRGLPEHWFGGGGDVNRATAAEMDAPSRKMIEKRQDKVKAILEVVFDYVIFRAVEARYLTGVPDDELYKYEVQKPEVSDKDVAKLSSMLQQVASSLAVAEANEWISREEAAKAFAFFLAFIGYEYTPEDGERPPEYKDYSDKKKQAEGGRLKAEGKGKDAGDKE